jgi:hypothetical protein
LVAGVAVGLEGAAGGAAAAAAEVATVEEVAEAVGRAAIAEGDRVAMALGEARAVRSVGMAATGVMEEAWVVGRGWAALAARTG